MANRGELPGRLGACRFSNSRAGPPLPTSDERFPETRLRHAGVRHHPARLSDRTGNSPACARRYGRNIYGQSVLLARRLIEAGTRVVTISWAPDANATWDTHGDNFNKLKNTLLPQFDAAASSLLDDLADRGMLDRTLVAVLGDFGRTPRINNAAGRDHWNVATRSCSPAAASKTASSTAPATAPARRRPSGRFRPATSLPRFTICSESVRTRTSTMSSDAPTRWCRQAG